MSAVRIPVAGWGYREYVGTSRRHTFTDEPRCAPTRLLAREDDEWMLTASVAKRLNLFEGTLFRSAPLRAAIRRKSRSLRGSKQGRGVGLLWLREDVEMVARIVSVSGVTIRAAAKIYLAMREGRL